MTTAEIIGIILGVIAFAGSLIAVYNKMSTKQELLTNDNKHLKEEVAELKTRVAKVEDEVYDHITEVKDKLHEILIKINKFEK